MIHWKKVHKKDALKWYIEEIQKVIEIESKSYKQSCMSIKRIGEKKLSF